MKCPNCNAIVLNSLETCPNCGNVLINKNQPEQIIQTEQPIEHPVESEQIIQTEQPVQSKQIDNIQKKKVNIVRCIAIPLLISVILFFITTITKLIVNPDLDSKILSIVQISLPILVLFFGPIIMYAIQVNKK